MPGVIAGISCSQTDSCCQLPSLGVNKGGWPLLEFPLPLLRRWGLTGQRLALQNPASRALKSLVVRKSLSFACTLSRGRKLFLRQFRAHSE